MRDTDKKAEVLISAAFIFVANVGLSFPCLNMKTVKQHDMLHLGKVFVKFEILS